MSERTADDAPANWQGEAATAWAEGFNAASSKADVLRAVIKQMGGLESFLVWCEQTTTDVRSTFDVTDEEWEDIRVEFPPTEYHFVQAAQVIYETDAQGNVTHVTVVTLDDPEIPEDVQDSDLNDLYADVWVDAKTNGFTFTPPSGEHFTWGAV